MKPFNNTVLISLCTTCHGKGFVKRGYKDIDACMPCTVAAEIEYQSIKDPCAAPELDAGNVNQTLIEK